GDISGYNYAWENEEEGEVSGLSAVIKSATDGDQQVRVINWVDVVPGLSFSLATTGSDLDGLDIEVIAEQVYVCVQGDD
ncbi:MAG: hypothetical protein K5840_07450, partial [Eubacterium sp.]|nr:hypothetical protein [Eubacterium sp.]